MPSHLRSDQQARSWVRHAGKDNAAALNDLLDGRCNLQHARVMADVKAQMCEVCNTHPGSGRLNRRTALCRATPDGHVVPGPHQVGRHSCAHDAHTLPQAQDVQLWMS